MEFQGVMPIGGLADRSIVAPYRYCRRRGGIISQYPTRVSLRAYLFWIMQQGGKDAYPANYKVKKISKRESIARVKLDFMRVHALAWKSL